MRPWLVVGGTGTLGNTLIPILLAHKAEYGFSRIRILSRDPHKQMKMQEALKSDYVDFFVGDVRDTDRIYEAMEGCQAVFHLAAFKNIDQCEYDPYEAILTNIIGTKNVMKAARKHGVKKALFTSTDKSVAPVNLYGATKLCGEKLWISGNIGAHSTKYAAVRYGNVIGSNSSVVEKWKQGPPYEVTDSEMTRFLMTKQEAAKFVLYAYSNMQGGEVFIPPMRSTMIMNLLEAVTGDIDDVIYIGKRPGEKVHESLVSEEESDYVTEYDGVYIRWPSHYLFPFQKRGVAIGRRAITSENVKGFSLNELKELICQ